jgi:hypothetical protein
VIRAIAVSVDAAYTVVLTRVSTESRNFGQSLIIEQGNDVPSTAPEEGKLDFVSSPLPSLAIDNHTIVLLRATINRVPVRATQRTRLEYTVL